MPGLTFEGYVLHDTGRAILFISHYWEEGQFFPKSQLEIRRDPDTQEVVIVASAWIARQKQLTEVDFAF